MHPATEKLIHELKDLAIEAVACDYAQRGYHYEIEIEGKQIRSLAECLLKHEMYLVFVGGLHVKPACRVIYQFASFERPCRIVIRAVVDEECQIPTISDIFDGADWHERETRDFYGIVFSDHPYLKPLILAEEDVDLKPLLKKEADLKEMGEVSWAPASAAAPKSEAPKPEAKKEKTEQG